MDPISDKISRPHSATILIVEDEDLMLRLLKKFFSRHGYVVLEASNGEQAIEVYRNNKQQIDAVLLDMRLPHKTGEEVFLEMKAENAAVNVVMASGFFRAASQNGADSCRYQTLCVKTLRAERAAKGF